MPSTCRISTVCKKEVKKTWASQLKPTNRLRGVCVYHFRIVWQGYNPRPPYISCIQNECWGACDVVCVWADSGLVNWEYRRRTVESAQWKNRMNEKKLNNNAHRTVRQNKQQLKLCHSFFYSFWVFLRICQRKTRRIKGKKVADSIQIHFFWWSTIERARMERPVDLQPFFSQKNGWGVFQCSYNGVYSARYLYNIPFPFSPKYITRRRTFIYLWI